MKRREFLQTTCATGVMTLVDTPELFGQTATAALERSFQNPPADAGISIVWHWTGGLVTKEGITFDLEGIAASGINTVNWFYFEGSGVSDGVQAANPGTPEWWDLVSHTMSEAKRLNLQIAPHVCSSWGPAGAPGITPELSQQQLVWSEQVVEGGRPFAGVLARPARPAASGRGGGGGGGAAAGGRGGAAAAQTPGGRGAAPPSGAAAAPAAAAAAGFGGGGRGGASFPPSFSAYYRDLAVLAFPVPADWDETSVTRKASVTTNLPITDLAKAADPNNSERVVTTDKAGWIQFAFDRPFTLRAVTMNPGGGAGGFGAGGGGGAAQAGNPYRIAHSLEVQASDDGSAFRKIGQLEPMFNGWQSTVSTLTHTVTESRARFFRLVYTPGPPVGYDEGMRTGTRTQPGDFANMIEPLGFASIVLSSTPTVHLLPAKNASTWGRGRLVSDSEIPAASCVPLASVVDLTAKMREDGGITDWTPPAGQWKVLRFGYASQLAATGGGLHCDKFSADAARIAFHAWFGEVRKRTPDANKFIKVLNIDSWEGRAQNWSPVLRSEFITRRGYDPINYLPCMAGVMVQSASATEGFLLDLRRTMSECIADNFYGTMQRLAHDNGCIVMSEDVNPATPADGMEYFKNTDWTGGEFWIRAAQNWKPHDVRDAVAGARIYGKKVVFAEAFTGGSWQDHPFAMKALGDHNFVEGVNRMMLHLWPHQHHPGRVPGAPGAGTPFQAMNTWWKTGSKPWLDYIKKSQALLQSGQPVSDALYFAGENIPCRSILPPRLAYCWTADPAMPEGFAQDTVNRDGLLRLTKVQNGRIVVNGTLSYRVLVLRNEEPYLTPAVAARLKELVEAGAVVVGPRPAGSPSLEMGDAGQAAVRQVAQQLWGNMDGKTITENRVGKGRVFWGKPMAEVLAAIGAAPDCQFTKAVNAGGDAVRTTASSPMGTSPVQVGAARQGWGMEYHHRQGAGWDFYFLSNQEFFPVSAEVSFRIAGKVPEFWFADTGLTEEAPVWREQNGRTIVPVEFAPSGSVFVVFRKASAGADPVVEVTGGKTLHLRTTSGGLETWAAANGNWTLKTKNGRSLVAKAEVPNPIPIAGSWNINFPVKGTPKTVDIPLGSWTDHPDEDVKYFSGTARYRKAFTIPAAQKAAGLRLSLDLGAVENIARVRLNGKDLGVLWKAPYVVDITAAAVVGSNSLEIEVTNTWVNRLAGDAGKPQEQRVTFGSGGRGGGFGGGAAAGPQVLPAGLIGPVRVVAEVKVQAV